MSDPRAQGRRGPVVHFVVPFYNNESSLRADIAALCGFLNRASGEEYEVVLCNDGSTDASLAVAEDLEREFSALRVVGYDVNRGRGYAVRFAAGTCGGRFLIFADADLPRTTDLRHILTLRQRLDDHPVAVGSRFLRESGTRRFWTRNIVGRTHRFLAKILFPRLNVTDPDVGFKGFDLAWLRKMNAISRMDRWSWDLEVLVIARANALSIAEIGIDWNERHEGHTSSVRLVRDAREEFAGMLAIRRNLRRGLYRL